MGSKYAFAYLWNADTALCALFSFDYVLFSFDYVLILDKGASLIRFTKLIFDFQAFIEMKPYQIVYLLSLIFM